VEITTRHIWGGTAVDVDGKQVASFVGKYAKVQEQVAATIARLQAAADGTEQEQAKAIDAVKYDCFRATSKQQERQRTRRAGQYARYDYRCEMCDRGISSQEDMTPEVFTSEWIEANGMGPCVCDRCMKKFDGVTIEQAEAILFAPRKAGK